MLHLGRGRLRRGLAAALIGEIAAVIDGMEGFEEVRKLEGMVIGADEHLDELGAFTLPRFSVYESNAGSSCRRSGTPQSGEPGMTNGDDAKRIPHQRILPVVPIRRGALQLISPPNQWLPFACLVPEKRGGSRSSRTLGTGCDGRDSVRRAGQMARGRMMLTRTAKSCGPGAPTLALSLRKRFRE